MQNELLENRKNNSQNSTNFDINLLIPFFSSYLAEYWFNSVNYIVVIENKSPGYDTYMKDIRILDMLENTDLHQYKITPELDKLEENPYL